MATRKTSDRPAEQSLQLRFDAFELDEADARLTRAGRPVPLAPKPFAVLCALARASQTLVTKNALLDRVWGHRFVSDSVLKSTISELRAALDDDPKRPRYIETVSRRGYRFIAALDARATAGGTAPAATSPMIGRADALERLRAAWQRAGTGTRQVVWIAGEAGVGKTTLIERFMAEVGEVHCARGQCIEQYGAGEPYLPVLEAIGALCRRDAAFAELVRAVAPTWLLQLPWLSAPAEREMLRRELAGAGQARMLREMARAPGALHGKSPVAARHRGPALERPGDGAAHGLPGAPSRHRAALVARELPPHGDHRGGPSAPRGASRASPAWARRGDCARRLLRTGGRAVRCRARSSPGAGREVRTHAAWSHRRAAALRRRRGERYHRARLALRLNGGADGPERHHRTLHTAARTGRARAAGGGKRLRRGVPAGHGRARAANATSHRWPNPARSLRAGNGG